MQALETVHCYLAASSKRAEKDRPDGKGLFLQWFQ